MTIFEFVLGLTSIITALALGHLLTGAVMLIRKAARVKFSLIHGLWVWSAFALTIGNWASNWELRLLTTWPAWAVLMLLFTTIAQYLICVFVMPDASGDGEIDLVVFHARERRRYVGVIMFFCVLALAFNFMFGAAFYYSQWLRDSALSIAALGVATLAFFAPARWAQISAGAAFAALATYFLIVSTNIGPA